MTTILYSLAVLLVVFFIVWVTYEIKHPLVIPADEDVDKTHLF